MLVMGDFNVTEREPGYADLSRGLQDAYAVRGSGTGSTWGPKGGYMGWRIPTLRIDYLLSSPNVVPVSASTDCASRGSDHCIVSARYEVR